MHKNLLQRTANKNKTWISKSYMISDQTEAFKGKSVKIGHCNHCMEPGGLLEITSFKIMMDLFFSSGKQEGGN